MSGIDFGTNPEQTISRLDPDTVRAFAAESGFDNAGFVSIPHAEETRDAERFTTWIDAGRGGSMHYLERKAEDGNLLRARVRAPFPWARSAVVCFANYNAAQPKSLDTAPPHTAWIARYAWSSRTDEKGEVRPSDYHKVLLKRLRAVEARLHETYGAFESRAYVDTGPLVERSLAVVAGLGWIGKNTCLIHPKLGSFGFLACLLTSLEFHPKDEGAELPDRCGSCTRCLDACPTNALVAPYQMDATRCISYLTIEHKGTIAPDLMEGMGRQIFGCDICQDVCPWNRKAPVSANPDLAPRAELVNPTLQWLSSLEEQDFERLFNGSPVRRAGFTSLRRNIAIAIANTGAQHLAPKLRVWAQASEQSLSAAAAWALEKLKM